MPYLNPKIRLCYLLTFTAHDVALALGYLGHNPVLWRWTSRFCGFAPGPCTLGAPDAEDLVAATERLIRRFRAARASGVKWTIVTSLEALFWVFFDAIERCLDLSEMDCVCSWERRIGDAEELTTFLIEVARVYWSTGAERDWMFKELEGLACRANEVSERDGSIARRADDDPSVEARADRLSVRLFDAANDLCCDNWANEDWMSVVPTN
jgi:hypothetical protein